MPRFWLPLSLVVAALAAPLGASARAAGMVAPYGYRAKDFTLVKRDGLYHLFYILHSRTLWFAQNERVLGHAISQDLYTWTQLDPVLPARPQNWDRDHIWAPSIVERDGVYYLFYTGVTDVGGVYASNQRLGVATSTDLTQWNRRDAPIFTCA